jgi:hypothetical protein
MGENGEDDEEGRLRIYDLRMTIYECLWVEECVIIEPRMTRIITNKTHSCSLVSFVVNLKMTGFGILS